MIIKVMKDNGFIDGSTPPSICNLNLIDFIQPSIDNLGLQIQHYKT